MFESIAGLESQANLSEPIVDPLSQTNSNVCKRPRFMDFFVCESKNSFSPQKSTLTTIDTSLSSIIFHLELILESEDYMRILVYTTATTNTSNKDHQLGVISQYPAMVTEYL